MTTRSAETSPLVYARVAGFLYLIIMVSAGFGGSSPEVSVISSKLDPFSTAP
jgi:hypothetical protein